MGDKEHGARSTPSIMKRKNNDAIYLNGNGNGNGNVEHCCIAMWPAPSL